MPSQQQAPEEPVQQDGETTTSGGFGISDYISATLFGKDDPSDDEDPISEQKVAHPDTNGKENGYKRSRSPFKRWLNDSGSRNGSKEETAVNGETVERSNPLTYAFRTGDAADRHEQRVDDSAPDGSDDADAQRLKIAHGNYRDPDTDHGAESYFGPAPQSAKDLADRDGSQLEEHLQQEQHQQQQQQQQQRPSLPGRFPSRKSVGFQDENDDTTVPHITWKRRLSKFAATPTALSLPTADSQFIDNRKWREFKSSILGFKRRDRHAAAHPRDIRKSEIEKKLDERARQRAEFLISSLVAGCPAALFAGSIFLRDEHGTQRAPLLLSLLGFQLTDITENPRNKQKTYRIELEYGVGFSRLKWSIVKNTRDFQALHARLKVLFFQANAFSKNDVELPKLPRWGHAVKADKGKMLLPGSASVDDGGASDGGANDGANDGAEDGAHDVAPAGHHAAPQLDRNIDDLDSMVSNMSHSSGPSHHLRESMSNALSRIHSVGSRSDKWSHQKTEHLNESYRDAMEHYIDRLVITLALRPQSNRVFQFFELSPIGVLLSSESGYQGKQGYLLVRTSAKAQGWRVGHLKLRELKDMVERHTNKWFLVRNSYIMYVNDIYSTTPLEVFLIDANTKIDFSGSDDANSVVPESDDDGSLIEEPRHSLTQKRPYLVIKLENAERKMKMIAKSERHLQLWVNSINTMISKTIWSQPKRFDSFAPMRDNCFAQWFVDARDYMWACSSAMEMAKETIYIHDWWLSPELYMRRPANGNQQWRIDRILKRKAEQGVKIFVIVYRNVGNTVVTDSSWTKHSLLDLHPNVYVIRSPNQLLQNTYFWAHHEKLCIVDSTICFLGGIDLCFGRFDTPDHILTDDAETAFVSTDGPGVHPPTEEGVKFQHFPGKDYSNPRVKDFFSLDKPYESMYNREEVPRMPWHDVHMVSAGQVARDLSRHFVQRWNYLLRQKRPSRPTPLLLPPSDLTPEEVSKMGFEGTCEVQLLRSSGGWSLGLKEHEQSIQNAYLKIIETSEHFVYLENQFFVTSAEWDGTVIRNRIGDALVDRIIRAHHEGKPWRAVIVIPLMPGFESQVSEADGSAVRVIMQCQFMSISRGSTSIFAKLRKVGIDPDDYIQFYSLRKWGKIGPNKKVVTEQLYIHAKTIMADDRIAIIGSANINERSMRGDRDSEVAAIVRDKEMVKTTMNGKPYLAGKFAHTLRMRLMREHLGVDVDILELVERRFTHIENIAKTELGRLGSTGKFRAVNNHILSAMVELGSREVLGHDRGTDRWKRFVKVVGGDASVEIPLYEEELPESLKESAHRYAPHPLFHTFNHRAGVENLGMRDKKKFSSDSRIHNNKDHKNDIDGLGRDHFKSESFPKSSKKVKNVIKEWAKNSVKPAEPFLPHADEVIDYLNDDGLDYAQGVDRELSLEEEEHLATLNRERWLFLKRVSYLQRCKSKQKEQEELAKAKTASAAESNGTGNLNKLETKESSTGPQSETTSLDDDGVKDLIATFVSTGEPHYNQFIDPYGFEDPMDEEFYEDVWYTNAVRNTRIYRMVFHCQPDDASESWTDYTRFYNLESAFEKAQKRAFSQRVDNSEPVMANGAPEKEIETPSNTLGVLGMRSEENMDGANTSSDTTAINETTPSRSSGSSAEEMNEAVLKTSSDANTDGEARHRRRRRAGTFASRHRNAAFSEVIYDKETALKILSHIQGHLVLFPADWLHKELEKGGSWFFNADRLPPIEIYD